MQLAKSDRAVVAETMPDAAALMWVLQEGDPMPEIAASLKADPIEEDSVDTELVMTGDVDPLSWWDRVSLWKVWPWNWRG